jgi:hypothetical protein
MMLLLLSDLGGQICELMADAFDPSARLFTLALVHLSEARLLSRTPDHGRGDLQIAHQCGARPRCFLQLTPGLQKQLRLFEQAFSQHP